MPDRSAATSSAAPASAASAVANANGGAAGLPTPRAAGSFVAPDGLDVKLFDPTTGRFGLFGTPVWGTRYGSTQPLQKIENVRPLCMDFFKSGFCNRKGPHNQGCLFRHDEIEGKGKIEAPPGADAAPRPLAPTDGPGAACREAKAPDGRTYYYHAATKETKWTRPTAAPGAAPTPLPEGWKEAKAPDGRTYYYHAATKETKWTRPTAAKESRRGCSIDFAAAPASALASAPAAATNGHGGASTAEAADEPAAKRARPDAGADASE
ncbi:hypothetical protein EMIHUDRAFT_236456 [Emiliania huxleyi CCMP1516]|uniref:WW domain-containing protein n=2 Tax=Emiliania huxleyi TaxID=2903 RepID=A0A0D3JTF0_EMIH1|nr:hypothetical protein EMIHUDRAFT_236456 [Emiliania huxleyi CCMP1516]EOD26785.1 hypothetical protein EMIHUDRAFT_236456 [Emiliania huxleyi CCMP1516]|eukprot:XP_005779214.1 hypothetical protein EMIHUDRAFT_236456 [Emiliania huxleyi CCMP1516]